MKAEVTLALDNICELSNVSILDHPRVKTALDKASGLREFLKVSDIADLMQVSKPTVEKWIKSGMLIACTHNKTQRVRRCKFIEFCEMLERGES